MLRSNMAFPYLGKLLKATFGVVYTLDPILSFRVPSLQGVAERGQPGVQLDDTCSSS